ncbi:MAG: TonB-dependent receptor [Candidatus Sulfotelmatobacter sp.]
MNYVPDAALRQSTPSPLQEVLNAFPAPTPNAPDLGNGVGEFIGTWSNPAKIDSYSIRLDHAVNEKLKLFFRFSDAPSNAAVRGSGLSGTPSMNSLNDYVIRTYTLGATSILSSRIGNDFRLNYSSNSNVTSQAIQSFGGAQAVSLAQLQGITAVTNPAYGVEFGLSFGPPPMFLTQIDQSGEQRQWNVVDTLSLSLGAHQFKFGIDYRRLSPIQRAFSPYAIYFYLSEASVQANSVDEGVGESNAVAYPVYVNFSAFAQDDWRLTPRLSLSMGLRWEVNPAPGTANGNLPYTVEGANDLSTMTLAPQGTPLWKTSWYNFAPRLGAAYVLRNSPRFETVLRGGGGVFFDTGQQAGSAGYQGPGLSAVSLFGNVFGSSASFPAPLSQAGPPIVNPPIPPYSANVYAFPSHFQLPYTLQWNASIEQALGSSQALTVSYVGSHGTRLLEQNQVNVCIPPSPCLNPNFGEVLFEKNGLTSDYDALQLQFQRRLSRGLEALASYTWSHSIDYGSYNFAQPYLRGNSDFDLRHSFSAALTYDLPNSGFENRFARATLHHWSLDTRFSARTAFPVTLNGNEIVDPATGVAYLGNLNLVPGQPIYIYGSQCATVYNNGKPCPGGIAINPNAFALPPSGPGDAPRNFARGFGAWQMDFAIRREFPLHERLKLQFRAEAFNIFNHPSFGQIDAYFTDPTFGQALATLNSSLPGLSPLYQSGGSRSMQLALKLMF